MLESTMLSQASHTPDYGEPARIYSGDLMVAGFSVAI